MCSHVAFGRLKEGKRRSIRKNGIADLNEQSTKDQTRVCQAADNETQEAAMVCLLSQEEEVDEEEVACARQEDEVEYGTLRSPAPLVSW